MSSLVSSLSLLLGLAAFGSWIFFNTLIGSWNPKLHPNPLVKLGLLLLGLWLVNYAATRCMERINVNPSRRRWVSSLCSLGMIVLVILILALTVSVFHINGELGQEIPGKAYRDYEDANFSPWFVKYIASYYGRHWYLRALGVVVDERLCQKYSDRYANQSESQFDRNRLTHIEAGCCKPPVGCNLKYLNATSWEAEKFRGKPLGWRKLPVAAPKSCRFWRNDQKHFCHSCWSCRAGLLASFKMEWMFMAAFNLLIFFLVLVFCSIRRHYRNVVYTKLPTAADQSYSLPITVAAM